MRRLLPSRARLFPWLTLSALSACGAEERAQQAPAQPPQEISASEGGPPPLSPSSDAGSDAARIITVTPTCSRPGQVLSDEFGECRDAPQAVDAALAHEAGVGDAALSLDASGARDASAETDGARDGAQPDAAESYGPCAESEGDCSHVRFEVQTAATCMLSGPFGSDALSVSFRACERCGKSGTINQYAVRIDDCGGCNQVYADVMGSSFFQSANTCRDLTRSNVRLAETAASTGCIDIYAGVGSSMNGSFTDGLHTIRVCRCDRRSGTCHSCIEGGCDAP